MHLSIKAAGVRADKTICGFGGAKNLTEVRGQVTCKRCLRWIAADQRMGGLKGYRR